MNRRCNLVESLTTESNVQGHADDHHTILYICRLARGTAISSSPVDPRCFEFFEDGNLFQPWVSLTSPALPRLHAPERRSGRDHQDQRSQSRPVRQRLDRVAHPPAHKRHAKCLACCRKGLLCCLSRGALPNPFTTIQTAKRSRVVADLRVSTNTN